MATAKPTKPTAITAVPTPVPLRTDRVNFAARGDAMMEWFETGVPGIGDAVDFVDVANDFVEEQANAAEASATTATAAALTATNASNVNGTSASTRTPSLASLTWVYVEVDRVPIVGMRLRAASRAAPTVNYGVGTVTAWDSGTKTVTMTVDVIGATPASASDWNLILDGERGEAGLMETTFVDKGTVSTGTCTFAIGASDRMQRVQAGGNFTVAVSGWPASGRLGELLIKGVNLGAHTITWPTISWVRYDGAFVASPLLAGATLQTSGTDFILLWTDDGGTTVYGKVMR